MFRSEQEWYLFLLLRHHTRIAKSIVVSGAFCIEPHPSRNMRRNSGIDSIRA